MDFLGLRLHHWAQTCRVLRRNGGRSQPSKMGTINFHYWRSQKKKMAIYLQAIFGNFSWCFLFFCVFFFACVILSLYHRSFLLLAMKHLKQLTKPFGLWHCEVYVKKRGPLQHSDQASTWYSVLLPASKDLKSSWSIAGVTSCYTAKYHLTQSCLSSKNCSAYILTLIISCLLISYKMLKVSTQK